MIIVTLLLALNGSYLQAEEALANDPQVSSDTNVDKGQDQTKPIQPSEDEIIKDLLEDSSLQALENAVKTAKILLDAAKATGATSGVLSNLEQRLKNATNLYVEAQVKTLGKYWASKVN
ncbi:MAG: hypothetical protein ACOY3I_04160 [Verrucomicrobiota bacterium]